MADPFSLLTVLPAPVSVEAAQQLLIEIFDVEGIASPLPGERDLNFKIEASNGRCYVFKLHHPEEDPAVVDLQDRALIRLATPPKSVLAPGSKAQLSSPSVTTTTSHTLDVSRIGAGSRGTLTQRVS